MTSSVDPTWFAGKRLSTDWSSTFFERWAELFATRRGERLEVLEIGSWEGRSALFFLHFFPHTRLTCVDTFEGGAEHVGDSPFAGEVPHVEERFRANTAAFADRMRVLVESSRSALVRLADEGARFDLVLVDGSHEADDVLADAEGSWALLRTGGWLVLDDYEWQEYADPRRTPKAGIDTFLERHAGELAERERGWQIVVERTSSA